MATQALERPVETPTPGQIIAKYQSQAPVDVVAIAAELGINVWETNSLSESISGKIFKDPLNGGSSGYSILSMRATRWHESASQSRTRSRILFSTERD